MLKHKLRDHQIPIWREPEPKRAPLVNVEVRVGNGSHVYVDLPPGTLNEIKESIRTFVGKDAIDALNDGIARMEAAGESVAAAELAKVLSVATASRKARAENIRSEFKRSIENVLTNSRHHFRAELQREVDNVKALVQVEANKLFADARAQAAGGETPDPDFVLPDDQYSVLECARFQSMPGYDLARAMTAIHNGDLEIRATTWKWLQAVPSRETYASVPLRPIVQSDRSKSWRPNPWKP